MRKIAAVALALTITLSSAPPAYGLEPPVIDPGATPPDVTGPDQPTEQRRKCTAPEKLPDSNFADPPWGNTYLRVAESHKFATGRGITVAVIDTGVNASPRVPAEPGGDFVGGGDGLQDCDTHGTLTASIIAGRPAPTDAFVGVAPEAKILSLRQTSEAFLPTGMQVDPSDPNTSPTAGSLRSLARAIVHAANLGAGVINVSEAACYKVTRPIDEKTLGAAINYATNVKNSVVVVAAGNTGSECTQNPPPNAAVPSDPRGWKQVQTVVSPAWYSPLLLTVGGIGQNGTPSGFSMTGPWLGVAAPAENMIALGYDGAPVNALPGQDGPVPINGTSFAAAYVSGVAALVRQRFPQLTANQVINRLISTSRHPGGGVNNVVGAGVVDPVAALTWDIPAGPATPEYKTNELPPPPPVQPPDRGPITAVVLIGAGIALAVGLGFGAQRALGRK